MLRCSSLNHWRSRQSEAQSHSDCFSVCAHGCDHTNNEFRSTDYEGLLRKTSLRADAWIGIAKGQGLRANRWVRSQEQYSLELRAFAIADSSLHMHSVHAAELAPQIVALICSSSTGLVLWVPGFKRHY
jgi:hypothetical protein